MAGSILVRELRPVDVGGADVAGVLTRAINETSSQARNIIGCFTDLVRFIDHGLITVLVGYEGDAPRAVVVLIRPTTHLSPNAQVHVMYNEGSPALGRELLVGIVKWAKESGYNELNTINTNKGRDAAHQRLFRKAGPAETIGTLLTYRVSEGEIWATLSEDFSEAEAKEVAEP